MLIDEQVDYCMNNSICHQRRDQLINVEDDCLLPPLSGTFLERFWYPNATCSKLDSKVILYH